MSDLGEITLCYTITFERTSPHPPGRLWRSITDPDEVTRWMTYPARIDLRIGGDYHVDFARSDGGELDGVIVRIEPTRRLAYVWGLSVLEWTIAPDGEGCRYTFVHHGQPPGLVDDEAGIATGWHAWLDGLDGYLAGGVPTPEDDHATYEALLPAYRERLCALLGARTAE